MNREAYFRIEPAIRTLVATLNAHGYRTYASCQGHGFPVVHRPPYVAFLCSHQDAVWLARKLRKDAESYTPRLFWGWSVLASFNSDFHLVWRLQPEGAHYWYCRYFRRTLATDFRTLTRLLKERAGDTGING
ncbi:TPA: hypothetical protein ACHIW3_004687 [Escherichia coli]